MHHNNLYDSVKTACLSGKNLVLELNANMLSANQIAEFLKLDIAKTIGCMKLIFLHAGTYLLKLQIDDVILNGWGQVSPGMPKKAFETLISQKQREV